MGAGLLAHVEEGSVDQEMIEYYSRNTVYWMTEMEAAEKARHWEYYRHCSRMLNVCIACMLRMRSENDWMLHDGIKPPAEHPLLREDYEYIRSSL